MPAELIRGLIYKATLIRKTLKDTAGTQVENSPVQLDPAPENGAPHDWSRRKLAKIQDILKNKLTRSYKMYKKHSSWKFPRWFRLLDSLEVEFRVRGAHNFGLMRQSMKGM